VDGVDIGLGLATHPALAIGAHQALGSVNGRGPMSFGNALRVAPKDAMDVVKVVFVILFVVVEALESIDHDR
jgi:hypothetical protein